MGVEAGGLQYRVRGAASTDVVEDFGARRLMDSMRPSATACRARSWLVQWVICPAIGSRQARLDLGLLRSPGELLEDRPRRGSWSCQAALLVRGDGGGRVGPVTLHGRGNRVTPAATG